MINSSQPIHQLDALKNFSISLLIGKEGYYNFFDFNTEFTSHNKISYSFYSPTSNFFYKAIGYSADFCLKSHIFQVLTLGYCHTFAHEMGHALASKILTGHSPKSIVIQTNAGTGFCVFNNLKLSAIAATVVDAAGPCLHMVFNGCQLILAATLSHYKVWPIALGLRVSSVIWALGEFLYMAHSINRENFGDFGNISKRGASHLIPATAVLVSIYALSILTAKSLL